MPVNRVIDWCVDDYAIDDYPPNVIAIESQSAYIPAMIRNKTLHTAARVLLGAFIAAYAMTSMHVYARAVPTIMDTRSVGANTPADESGMEEHCQTKQIDPAILLCKFHCQNAVQTLDHPAAAIDAWHDAAVLIIPVADLAIARKPLLDKALRPEATHHGGAPPPFARTSRLRI